MLNFFSKKNKKPGRNSISDQPGCFGKMPMHPEFIRQNIVSREAIAFVNWLQEGVGEVQRKKDGDYKDLLANFPTMNFVFGASENDHIVAGTISPSRDQSGRKYPIAVFSTIDVPLFMAMPATTPCMISSFLEQTATLAKDQNNQQTVQEFSAKVNLIHRTNNEISRRTLLEKEISLIKPITVGTFWQQCFPEQTVKQRIVVFFSIYTAMKKIIQRSSARTTWGLRFPLPAQDSPIPAITFWLQTIESILEERQIRFHYFWNNATAETPASLVVFFRPMPPSYFKIIIEPDVNDTIILDIAKSVGDPASARNILDLESMLAKDDTSMLDVLYNAGRKEMVQ